MEALKNQLEKDIRFLLSEKLRSVVLASNEEEEFLLSEFSSYGENVSDCWLVATECDLIGNEIHIAESKVRVIANQMIKYLKLLIRKELDLNNSEKF
jgi:hypothetical protein